MPPRLEILRGMDDQSNFPSVACGSVRNTQAGFLAGDSNVSERTVEAVAIGRVTGYSPAATA